MVYHWRHSRRCDTRNVLINAQASVKVDVSGIEVTEKVINSEGYQVKLNVVRPTGVKDKLPVFIFVHGGGWVLGDFPTHKRFVRDLVVLSGCVAVFVNYTPSPEARYPQAINEIYAATKWVAEHGDEVNVDGKKLAIVGNSVGGDMATVTASWQRRKAVRILNFKFFFGQLPMPRSTRNLGNNLVKTGF